MVGYITESAGGSFEPTPEGRHLMVCCRVIDLGTQNGGSFGLKRKIRIFWELPKERITWTDADGVEKEGPVLHSEAYNVSFHEKSNLGKMLADWRGKPFTKEDFSGPPNGFHLSKIIGVPMSGMIVHEEGNDGVTYANLKGVKPASQDDLKEYRDQIEGPRIFFDLDDYDDAEFEKLSDRIKEKIKETPEYRALTNGEQDKGYTPQSENPDPNHGRELEDEIPF